MDWHNLGSNYANTRGAIAVHGDTLIQSHQRVLKWCESVCQINRRD
jgi:hypothetical protein